MTVAVPACIRFPNCRTVQGEGPACLTGNVFILLCRLWMMPPWQASGCMGQDSWLAGLAASCFGQGPGRAACLVEQLFHDWIGHMESARQLLAAKKINNA